MQNDSSNRLSQLLQQEEDLNLLFKQEAFQRTLQPLLMQELTPTPLKRQDFPSLDKFLEAQDLQVAKVEVYSLLLKLFSEAEKRAQKIRELEKQPKKDFAVGNG